MSKVPKVSILDYLDSLPTRLTQTATKKRLPWNYYYYIWMSCSSSQD